MSKHLAFLSSIWLVGFLVFALIGFESLVEILEKWASPDGHIEYPQMVVISVILVPVTHFIPLYLIGKILIKWKVHSLKLFICYLIFFIMHIFSYFNTSYFSKIVTEDNLGEWLTVLFSLTGSLLFLASGYYGVRLAYLLGFGWFFFAMEEISWGQRIFGFNSPDFFLSINIEREVTIHNLFAGINSLYILINLFILMFLTSLRNVKVLKQFYLSSNVYPLLHTSDKYCLWVFPVLLILSSIFSGRSEILQEFVEQQWGIFGLLYSSLLLYTSRQRA